jgi:hypothetical protein
MSFDARKDYDKWMATTGKKMEKIMHSPEDLNKSTLGESQKGGEVKRHEEQMKQYETTKI